MVHRGIPADEEPEDFFVCRQPHALPAEQVLDEHYSGLGDENLLDSEVYSVCEQYCIVEPHDRCPHGHPSILVALGIIHDNR